MYNSHEELIHNSTFAGRPVKDLIVEIQEIYTSDERPWIIGFSGGKDSTTVLSLVYFAISMLPESSRQKPLYVVSSDTLVETPVVVDQIEHVLDSINREGEAQGMPFTAHAVHPKPDQTFWVNLLGRGYPAPTQNFRWCTERMKIDPVSQFITERASEYGEVIVVLGSRSEESSSRAQVIAKHRIDGSALSRHKSLPNAYTYMPIEEWSADEVWEYLLSADRPWGGSNKTLFELYKGSNQGECPLVIDTSTPSCGNSRFGCWTCTVVTEDKAIHGLIESGADWMQPLLEFRNELYKSTNPELKNRYRNFKRRTGRVTYVASKDINDDDSQKTKHIPGPYWLEQRKTWLVKLLSIEKKMRAEGHEITLIYRDELHEIRQQWLRDPNEPDWMDSLPMLFSEVYPDELINWIENDSGVFTGVEAELLETLGEKHDISPQLVMKLIDAEIAVSGLGNRRGIQNKLGTLLSQDWDSFEEVSKRRRQHSSSRVWRDELESLNGQLSDAPQ